MFFSFFRFFLVAVLVLVVCAILVGGGMFFMKGWNTRPPVAVTVQHDLPLPEVSTGVSLPSLPGVPTPEMP